MYSNQKHACTLTSTYEPQWIATEWILGGEGPGREESWAAVGPLSPLDLSLRGAKMDWKRRMKWKWLKAAWSTTAGLMRWHLPPFDTSSCCRWGCQCCYVLVLLRPIDEFSKSMRWFIIFFLFINSTLCTSPRLWTGNTVGWKYGLKIFFLSRQVSALTEWRRGCLYWELCQE